MVSRIRSIQNSSIHWQTQMTAYSWNNAISYISPALNALTLFFSLVWVCACTKLNWIWIRWREEKNVTITTTFISHTNTTVIMAVAFRSVTDKSYTAIPVAHENEAQPITHYIIVGCPKFSASWLYILIFGCLYSFRPFLLFGQWERIRGTLFSISFSLRLNQNVSPNRS